MLIIYLVPFSWTDGDYVMESGFYMTSFAATILIAALVTVGVLLVTLLITLAVMLQACQSRSAGVIENQKLGYDYSNCKTLALQAELNNWEASYFPKSCRVLSVQYIEEGQYARDLNSTAALVENHFESLNPVDDGLDVVLMDIDDILSSIPQYANLLLQGYFPYTFYMYCFLNILLFSFLESSLQFMQSNSNSNRNLIYRNF